MRKQKSPNKELLSEFSLPSLPVISQSLFKTSPTTSKQNPSQLSHLETPISSPSVPISSPSLSYLSSAQSPCPSSLSETLTQKQQSLKSKAQSLHNQLVTKRTSLEHSIQKSLKSAFITHFQHTFQQFQLDLQLQLKQQSSTLQLIHELKITELNDIEHKIINFVQILQKDLKECQEKEKEIGIQYEGVIAEYDREREREKEDIRRGLEIGVERVCRQFRASIAIQ